MRARGTGRAAGAAVGLVAWMLLIGGGARPSSAQGGGGTFSLPIIDNARMWPIVGGLPNILVNKVIYSTVVMYDPKNWTPVGDLAERWTIGDDKLTWTFALRRNAPGTTGGRSPPAT